MQNGTKLSVSKPVNTRLTIQAAKLGMPKTVLLDKIGRVPTEDLRDLLKKADNEVLP